MPRGIYKRKATNETHATPAQAKALIVSNLSALPWMTKLSPEEQREVQSEGTKLAQSLLHYGQSKLAVGEHLAKLQGLLEPHRLFQRFLKFYHFNKRTAYRYISGFRNAKARLPETVLKAAMQRGVNIVGDNEVKPLGIYTAAVEKLPPPQNASEIQANTWLDQIEDVRKQTRTEDVTHGGALFALATADPQTMLKECFRFVHLRYRRLPNSAKARANWTRALVGMLLADMGVSGQQSFAPVRVPEDFVAQRGRPATQAATA